MYNYPTFRPRIGETSRKKIKQQRARQKAQLVSSAGRRYIVFFKMNSALEGKYAVIGSSSLENAFFDAIAKFGPSVSRCAIENDYELSRIKLHNYEPIDLTE